MATTRIKDLSKTATTLAADSNFVLDGSTNGTQKITTGNVKADIATSFAGDISTYGIATLGSDNKLNPDQLPDSVTNGINFVGTADSGSDLTSTTQGDFYIVNTAFTHLSISYAVGDSAVYNGSAYVKVTPGTTQIGEGGTGASTLDGAKANLEIPDVGTAPNEVPLNSMLSGMAYMSPDSVSMGNVEAESLEVTDQASIGATSGAIAAADDDAALVLQQSVGGVAELSRATDTDGHVVGKVNFANRNNSNTVNPGSANYPAVAGIEAQLETTDSNAHDDSGGHLVFKTKPEAGLIAERLRIDALGALDVKSVGGASAAQFPSAASVNGITALPSATGTPFIVGRDTGSLRSAHFAGHLKFDSGYGIDFGSGSTLGDYDSGSVTATDQSGAGLTLASNSGTYIKVGNKVTVWVAAQYPATSDTSSASIGSLPFAFGSSASDRVGGIVAYTTYASHLTVLGVNGTGRVLFYKPGGIPATNAELTGKHVWFSVTYDVS